MTVGGLTAYMPVAVGLDQTSLADPMLVPKKALQVVVPAPGRPSRRPDRAGRRRRHRRRDASRAAGSASKASISSWSTPRGKVAGTARTDFDGFFLFERVAYGPYTRADCQGFCGRRRRSSADLGLRFEVSADKAGRPPRRHSGEPLPVLASSPQRRRSLAISTLSARSGSLPDWLDFVLVRSRRLELPRPFGHSDLNAARLPVPPRPHVMKIGRRSATATRQGAASSKGPYTAQWRLTGRRFAPHRDGS